MTSLITGFKSTDFKITGQKITGQKVTSVKLIHIRAFGVFVLLMAVYFLTYTGQPLSTDEQTLVDAVQSLARNGTMELAYTSEFRAYTTQPEGRVVLWFHAEPLQVYAAVPLTLIAKLLPGVGMMQAAWTLNLFVTAATAAVLYLYGRTLGYGDAATLIAAGLYGVATYAWAYTQMFFREPLFTLLMLVCALLLEHVRRSRSRAVVILLLGAVLAFVAALNTKEAGVFMLPAFALILMPRVLRRIRISAAVLVGVPAAILVAAALLNATGSLGGITRAVEERIQSIEPQHIPEALSAYLFAPGFALPFFSPVLVLSVVGAWRLLRAGKLREFAVPLAVFGAFVVSYGMLRGSQWYGGLGWGARYLLPTMPFLALLMLPVFERAAHWRAWERALVIGIAAQSIFLQALSVYVPTRAFPNYLYSEGLALNRELAPWRDGTWNPLYVPQVVSAHQYGAPSEIAWMVNDAGWVVVPLCLITMAAGIVILRGRSTRLALLGGVCVLIMLYGGLRSFERDRRMGADNPALWRVLDHIDQNARAGDAVILNNRTYNHFFQNHYKLNIPIYTMPLAEGEVLEIGVPPEIVTDNAEGRAHPYSQELLARLAQTTRRWWFVTEYEPYTGMRFRATEHYLARHYFPMSEPISEIQGDKAARLLLYAPIGAPPDRVPPFPANPVNADFGAAVLVGYDAPRGTTLRSGELLPISLLWRHDGFAEGIAPLDYSVNVSLIGSGAAVAQRVAAPQGTFGRMSTWIPGGYYRDNHALPLDVPPGEYEVWVLVYDYFAGRNLPVISADAGADTDHVVIARITVTE
jgi:hypothetical protein